MTTPTGAASSSPPKPASAAAAITYHPNLLVNQVTHQNGVVETWSNDPNSMRRPNSISATGPAASWSSGAYVYDGTGIQQGYTFDPIGNLTAITGANARNTPTTAATNRLTSGTYDAAGNLTNWNGAVYQYDRFNQMLRMTSGAQDWAYVYTADDERIWSYNLAANISNWTLRDLSGQVLREYANENGAWTVGTDYIHRDGQLLAAETRLGRRHFHLDHLGTPRLITSSVGYKKAYHAYYPFGEEATAFNQDSERMKFTGHERDLASAAGAGDDLDYLLYDLLALKVGKEISVEAFCKEFKHAYNFGVSAEDLTDQEECVFRGLFSIVAWYSPSLEDRVTYPKHFKDEREIIEAIIHARRELGSPIENVAPQDTTI